MFCQNIETHHFKTFSSEAGLGLHHTFERQRLLSMGLPCVFCIKYNGMCDDDITIVIHI